jgi:hypothetical protein
VFFCTRVNPKRQKQIWNQIAESVDSFTYLGSTVRREGGILVDVRNRIPKADSAFIQLLLYGTIQTSPGRANYGFSGVMLKLSSYMVHKHGNQIQLLEENFKLSSRDVWEKF